eukprot:gnl/TRDRNA2_/TRDRNA2_198809_c0_seq1.p1 gnl/TRDRNA2_/TRDRNA2_198809_c0~~gnl/TRDRNA2_/TRDRNA2_198809_c0_seq1.p1  ORF type:complete len:418 (+),score=65.79 gnl/TRDRNA2_/TRDRNA2_198809_c0_seq1:45-1298(+)
MSPGDREIAAFSRFDSADGRPESALSVPSPLRRRPALLKASAGAFEASTTQRLKDSEVEGAQALLESVHAADLELIRRERRMHQKCETLQAERSNFKHEKLLADKRLAELESVLAARERALAEREAELAIRTASFDHLAAFTSDSVAATCGCVAVACRRRRLHRTAAPSGNAFADLVQAAIGDLWCSVTMLPSKLRGSWRRTTLEMIAVGLFIVGAVMLAREPMCKQTQHVTCAPCQRDTVSESCNVVPPFSPFLLPHRDHQEAIWRLADAGQASEAKVETNTSANGNWHTAKLQCDVMQVVEAKSEACTDDDLPAPHDSGDITEVQLEPLLQNSAELETTGNDPHPEALSLDSGDVELSEAIELFGTGQQAAKPLLGQAEVMSNSSPADDPLLYQRRQKGAVAYGRVQGAVAYGHL